MKSMKVELIVTMVTEIRISFGLGWLTFWCKMCFTLVKLAFKLKKTV